MARSAEELCPWTQPSYTSPPFSGLNLYEKKSRNAAGAHARYCQRRKSGVKPTGAIRIAKPVEFRRGSYASAK